MGPVPRSKWTAAQIDRYNAWRKPLEDTYGDILPSLETKYGAKIEDTDVVIVVEMVAGQYNIPGYGANDVYVSVCSPAGNLQIGERDAWTVHVFDYALTGAMVTSLHKKGADTAWVLASVDTAMRRASRYVQSRIKAEAKAQKEHDRHMASGGLRKATAGSRQLRCRICESVR